MTALDKNQMVDKLDAQRPQEKHGFAGRRDVGVARLGNIRRVIVRHDDPYNATAQQVSPTSRRDNAAALAITADAFEADKPFEGVEPCEEQRLVVGSEMRTQQMPRDVIFGFKSDVASQIRRTGRMVDGSKQGHGASHARGDRDRQSATAPLWTLCDSIPAAPLSAWRAQPSKERPNRERVLPESIHYELQYLDLMRRIWVEGDERVDRTGVGTRSLFGETMRFSLKDDAIPLLTTKRVYWKTALRELLWFLTGDTNIRSLVSQGVKIWTDWPLEKYRKATGEAISAEDFEARIIADDAFAAQWGDLGPVYGHQWVNWPRYEPAGEGLFRRAEQGHNQIAALIEGLKTNPGSRRHIFTGWNVADLDRMALPPCHMTYQFHVRSDGGLSCLLFQRSCDLGLGFAFNVFEAALLTRMVADQCGVHAHELVWTGGDVHLYLNHAELVEQQMGRIPDGAPRLRILRRPESIFEYNFDDFAVEAYAPQAHIAAPVAV